MTTITTVVMPTISRVIDQFISYDKQDILERKCPREPRCDMTTTRESCCCGNVGKWSVANEHWRAGMLLCDICLVVCCREYMMRASKVRVAMLDWIDYDALKATRTCAGTCYWCNSHDDPVRVAIMPNCHDQTSGRVICAICVKRLLIRKYSYHFWLLQCMLHRDCPIGDVVVYCSSVCRSVFVM